MRWPRRQRRRPSQAAEDHRRSLSARPVRAACVSATARNGGGLLVRIRFRRPRWQTLLGATGGLERTFGLDPIGRQVYEWCDGQTTVAELVRRFARDKQVAAAEAEAAVTRFLRALLAKGLILMEMQAPAGRREP